MWEAIFEIINNPKIRANLNFEPGKIQWINNASIGHRRTSYLADPDGSP